MTIPIYVIDRTPTADPAETVKWESICHNRPIIAIRHHDRRDCGRWHSVERKRPFCVWHYARKGQLAPFESWHKTLDHAKRAAQQIIADEEERARLAARPQYTNDHTVPVQVVSYEPDASDVTDDRIFAAVMKRRDEKTLPFAIRTSRNYQTRRD